MNRPGRPDPELVEAVRALVKVGQPEALIREVALATARDLARERVNPTGLGPNAIRKFASAEAQYKAYKNGVDEDSPALVEFARLGEIVASIK